MTTLMLDDNLVARLKSRAAAEGLGLEQYLARLLERSAAGPEASALGPDDDLEAFLDAFFTQNPEKLPPHDDISYSRQDIYLDHD